MSKNKLVVHISRSPLAGAPIRMINALNEYTDYEARLINTNPDCYGKRTFPEDLVWKKDRDICLDLISRADIIHFHHYFDLENNFLGVNFLKDTKKDCKFLRHYHTDLNTLTSGDKQLAEEFTKDSLNRVVIPHYPERTFLDSHILPNIIPIYDENMKPKQINNKKVKVLYSASTKASRHEERWATKGYPEVTKKLKYLSKKLDFEYIELFGVPYEKAMKIKQTADIIIGDIVTGSYHLTELEALSQGKVVISYLDARSVMTLINVVGCDDLPFVNATLDELNNILKELIENKALREEIGAFSRDWIEKYYDDKVLVNKFVEVYDKILNNVTIKREGCEEFSTAKEFLYNRVYDIKWEDNTKYQLKHKVLRKVKMMFSRVRIKIVKIVKYINVQSKNLVHKINLFFKIPFDYKQYWTSDDMNNVIPLNHGQTPEGFDPKEILRKLTEEISFDSVLDFGCGYGRISQTFPAEKYTGIDLNPNALKKARENNPGYKYEETFVNAQSYPVSDLTYAYTVFLHLDDETLENILSKLSNTTGKYFIIAEILGKEWANMGQSIPPTYCREKEEYESLMKKQGFELIKEMDLPYSRYVNDERYSKMKNKNISFLLFEKQIKDN